MTKYIALTEEHIDLFIEQRKMKKEWDELWAFIDYFYRGQDIQRVSVNIEWESNDIHDSYPRIDILMAYNAKDELVDPLSEETILALLQSTEFVDSIKQLLDEKEKNYLASGHSIYFKPFDGELTPDNQDAIDWLESHLENLYDDKLAEVEMAEGYDKEFVRSDPPIVNFPVIYVPESDYVIIKGFA